MKHKPYVIAASYRLLNFIIQHPSSIKDPRMYSGLLVHKTAQSIFEAIEKCITVNIAIDSLSLYQEASKIDLEVTKDVTDTILNIETKSESIDDAISILQEARQLSDLSNQAEELIEKINNSTKIDSSELSSQLQDLQTTLNKSIDSSHLLTLTQWTDEYLEDLRHRAEGINKYPYGDELLDKAVFKGAYPGAITTIFGATGQGKSAFSLNLLNGRINLRLPSMYFSLEMSKIDTFDRLISLRKEIPMENFYSPDQVDMDALIREVESERKELEENTNFFFCDKPMLTIAEIRVMIREFKQRTNNSYCFIVIDLITQVQDFVELKKGMSTASTIGVGMNWLNIIAKEENVHFFIVVQANRDADSSRIESIADIDSLRPTLNTIRDSNVIAERSRLVISCFRPRYYIDRYLPEDEEAQYEEDTFQLQVLKNSSGSYPRLKYLWQGEIMKVTPLIEDEKSEEIQHNF